VKGIVPSRRLLVSIAVAAAAGVASAAGVGYAQDGGSKPAASTPATTAAPAPGILAGVQAGLAGLVAEGTIDQHQADAVQQQADAGSIDPKTLVGSGVVSDPQMRAIANVIDQVKRTAG
jgi:hypothetical protein